MDVMIRDGHVVTDKIQLGNNQLCLPQGFQKY